MSSTVATNDISSVTTRPRALIFGMQHCLVDFYQVCNWWGAWGIKWPCGGGGGGSLGSKVKYT